MKIDLRSSIAPIVLFLPTAGLIAGLAAAQDNGAFAKNLFGEPDAPPAFSAAPVDGLTFTDPNKVELFEEDEAPENAAPSKLPPVSPPDPNINAALIALVADSIKQLPNPPVTCSKPLPPKDCVEAGRLKDRINLIIIGSRRSLCSAFKKAGWSKTHVKVAPSFLLMLITLWKCSPNAPMKRQWLFGKQQDASYAAGLIKPFRRHHFRLWKLDKPTADGREVWAGGGIFDKFIKFDLESGIDHSTDRHIDKERDKILESLQKKGLVEQYGYITLPDATSSTPPLKKKKPHYVTDGQTLIIELR